MQTFVKENCLSTSFNIPADTEIINLVNCPLVKHIEIPNSVKIIKCEHCLRLDNIVLPDSVESVNFKECFNLTNIILNNGLIRIDKQGFKGCKNLKQIYIPDTVVEFGEGDLIYDSDYSLGCFENWTEVLFNKQPDNDINIIIENEKLKRQVKQYQKMLNVLNTPSEPSEPVVPETNVSWYTDEYYNIYKSKDFIETLTKQNYDNIVEEPKNKKKKLVKQPLSQKKGFD